MAKNSLLNKAKTLVRTPKVDPEYGTDHVELLKAYLAGEITIGQASYALFDQKDKATNATTQLLKIAQKAYQEGEIK